MIDEYDITKQIKSQGILNILKKNIANRKRLNPLPSVQNVSSLFVFSSKNRLKIFFLIFLFLLFFTAIIKFCLHKIILPLKKFFLFYFIKMSFHRYYMLL